MPSLLLAVMFFWGFDGYVTSDCDADRNVYNTHKYTKTRAEAVRDVLDKKFVD